MKKEYWFPILDYDNYEVNLNGKVRNAKTKKILAQYENSNGYLYVCLSERNHTINKKVHRLVAEAFILNEDDKPQVNHKDGNKKNNNVSNLEWTTNKENMIHAKKSGLLKFNNEKHNIIAKDKVTQNILNFNGINEASRITGINKTSIRRCCEGKVKSAGNYYWEYY